MFAMNTVKTFSLLIVLTVLLVVAGYVVGGSIQGAVVAFIFALLMNFVAFWFSDRLVLSMAKAKEVTDKESPRLHEIVQMVALKANIPKPKVYVIDNPSPNAFATGRSPRHAAVAATTGIMSLLSRDELEGVIAHEIAHIRNRDTLIMTVAAAIAGAISMLAIWARWSLILGGGRQRQGGSPIALVGLVALAILMPLAALVVRLAISRAREYHADASGARISGKPWSLASALESLENGSRARPLSVNEAVSHLFIVNPLKGESLAALFSTHPPIRERVRRLRGTAL